MRQTLGILALICFVLEPAKVLSAGQSEWYSLWMQLDSGMYSSVTRTAADLVAQDSLAVDILLLEVRAALGSADHEAYRTRVLSSSDADYVGQMRKALTLEQLELVQQSFTVVSRLRTTHPNGATLTAYARLARRLGRTREAERLLTQLADSTRYRAEALGQLAGLYAARGDYPASDSCNRELVDTRANPFLGLTGLAWNNFMKGNYEEAVASLRKLCEEHPLPSSYLFLSRVWRNLERYEEAWVLLEEAMHRWPQSRSLQAEAARVADRLGFASVAGRLAESLSLPLRSYYGVATLFDRALALDDTLALQSEAEGLLSNSLDEAWIALRYIDWLRRRNRDVEADAWLDSIVTSMSLDQHAQLRTWLTSELSPQRALDTVRSLYADSYPSNIARTMEACLLYSSGEVDAARVKADSILRESPGDAYLLSRMADLETRAREYDRVQVLLAQLEQAGLAPLSLSLRRLDLHYVRGEIGLAERTLDSLRKDHSGEPRLLWYCGTLYDDREKRQKLAQSAEEALSSDRRPEWMLGQLRYMLTVSDQSTRAESLLSAVIAQHPSAAMPYYERGVTCYVEGRFDDAERDFVRARELNPFNPKYQQTVTGSSLNAMPLTEAADPQNTDTSGIYHVTLDSLRALAAAARVDAGDPLVVLRDYHQTIYTHNGRRIRRMHRVQQARTGQGAKELGTISVGFSGLSETPRVILARTIRSDGSIENVSAGAVYVSNIGGARTDSRVLQWSYPRVDSGSIVEMLVQFEQEFIDKDDVYQFLPLNEDAPIVSTEVELRVPTLWPMITRRSANVEFSTQQLGDMTVYRWTGAHLPKVIFEGDAPGLMEQCEWLRYAYRRTWRQEASTYWHKIVDKIDTGETIRNTAGRVMRGAVSREDTIRTLYRFVTDSIRYEAIEFGEGTIVPRRATTTLQNGYGDCKDKTVLLVSLLRQAGVEGYAALFSTEHPTWFDPEVPDLAQFDHVMVYVPSLPSPWLDPTCEKCRMGDATRQTSDRFALIIGADMEDPLVRTPKVETVFEGFHRRARITPLDAGGARYDIGIEFQGQTALNLRSNISFLDSADLRTLVEIQLGVGIAQNARLIDLVASDGDAEAMGYTLRATFESDETFDLQSRYTQMEANLNVLELLMTRPDTVGRRLDVAFDLPIRVIDEVTIVPGPRWELFSSPVTWHETNEWFTLSFVPSTLGDSVQTVASFELTDLRIARDSIRSFLLALDRMDRRFSRQSPAFRRRPDATKLTALQDALEIAPTDISLYMALAQEYLGDDQGGFGCRGNAYRQAAIEVLADGLAHDRQNEMLLIMYAGLASAMNGARLADSLLGEVPAGGQMAFFTNMMRLEVSRLLGRYEEAIALTEGILSVSPSDELRGALVGLLVDAGDLQGAEKQIRVMEAMHADSAHLIPAKFACALGAKDWAVAENLIAVWPDTSAKVRRSVRLNMLAKKKDYAELVKRYRTLLEEDPEDPLLLNNCAFYRSLLDSDLTEALEMIDKAIAIAGECNVTYRNTRGTVLLALGRLDEAEAEFLYCLEDDGAASQTYNHYYLGRLFQVRGDIAKAREHFESAIESGGDRDYEAESRRALEQL